MTSRLSTGGNGTPSGAGELLQLMLDGTPRTRAQLIELTGLARSTVGARVDALLSANLLTASGEAASTGGRPPAQLAFNPQAGVAIGIDVGATHALVALTDLLGRVRNEKAVSIDVTKGPKQVLDKVATVAEQLLRDEPAGSTALRGIGIGLPGPVQHSTGRPVRPPIMPGWDNYDVPEHLGARLSGPVLVDNDVNLMALGEHAAIYPSVDQMLFVKVATGVGAGIISGGRLHRGAQGAAGDLGHVASPSASAVPCTCGNVGCLEALASGPAIIARLQANGSTVRDTSDLVRLAQQGDLGAVAAIREAGREIGRVLATCVSLLNPSIIVVGGALAQASEQLLAGIREVVYGRSLPLATGELQIVAARTAGHAAVIGAATMAIQHMLSIDSVDRRIALAATGSG